MKTAGIICEYNPFHIGHLRHIEKTREALGGEGSIICVMSGNFTQRGDVAVFGKHARAKTAVLCGADIVIELPCPYALGSAREFAKAGVYLLGSLGVCDYLSFGSEAGSLEMLQKAAGIIITEEADSYIKEALGRGLPYAKAQQKAADMLMGKESGVFKHPNNTLGIEYIKAINEMGSSMLPMTVKRTGGDHDGNTGCSASKLRGLLAAGEIPAEMMPPPAAEICRGETASGRGPVFIGDLEQAVLSRIRAVADFSDIPGASDGLGHRFSRFAKSAPSVESLLSGVKTKRFAMSRIRRVLMCAALGITNGIAAAAPRYIRILAMNRQGMKLLKNASKCAALPVITKPASVRGLDDGAVRLFDTESSATDLYVLAYANEENRSGGSEWRTSPVIV